MPPYEHGVFGLAKKRRGDGNWCREIRGGISEDPELFCSSPTASTVWRRLWCHLSPWNGRRTRSDLSSPERRARSDLLRKRWQRKRKSRGPYSSAPSMSVTPNQTPGSNFHGLHLRQLANGGLNIIDTQKLLPIEVLRVRFVIALLY